MNTYSSLSPTPLSFNQRNPHFHLKFHLNCRLIIKFHLNCRLIIRNAVTPAMMVLVRQFLLQIRRHRNKYHVTSQNWVQLILEIKIVEFAAPQLIVLCQLRASGDQPESEQLTTSLPKTPPHSPQPLEESTIVKRSLWKKCSELLILCWR